MSGVSAPRLPASSPGLPRWVVLGHGEARWGAAGAGPQACFCAPSPQGRRRRWAQPRSGPHPGGGPPSVSRCRLCGLPAGEPGGRLRQRSWQRPAVGRTGEIVREPKGEGDAGGDACEAGARSRGGRRMAAGAAAVAWATGVVGGDADHPGSGGVRGRGGSAAGGEGPDVRGDGWSRDEAGNPGRTGDGAQAGVGRPRRVLPSPEALSRWSCAARCCVADGGEEAKSGDEAFVPLAVGAAAGVRPRWECQQEPPRPGAGRYRCPRGTGGQRPATAPGMGAGTGRQAGGDDGPRPHRRPGPPVRAERPDRAALGGPAGRGVGLPARSPRRGPARVARHAGPHRGCAWRPPAVCGGGPGGHAGRARRRAGGPAPRGSPAPGRRGPHPDRA